MQNRARHERAAARREGLAEAHHAVAQEAEPRRADARAPQQPIVEHEHARERKIALVAVRWRGRPA